MPNSMNNYYKKQKELEEAKKRREKEYEEHYGKVRIILGNGKSMPAVNYFKQQEKKGWEKAKKNPPGNVFWNGGKRKTRKVRKARKGTRKA
jgi:hypothetical protein